MAPRADPETSFPELSFPTHLKHDGFLTGKRWLDGKVSDDGAEGLWRVHDELYDLTSFVDRHPGGADWLRLTKGTDITEAFETHHVASSSAAERALAGFRVRAAAAPRHSPFTFAADGFYRALRRRVADALDATPARVKRAARARSERIAEALALAAFGAACASCALAHPLARLVAALASGYALSAMITAAHNFAHGRDNWRMYLFNFSWAPCREFRVTHALSHHLFPNTLLDYEVHSYQPFFYWLPRKSKNLFNRFAPVVYAFLVYMFMFDGQLYRQLVDIKRAKSLSVVRMDDLVPFTLPLTMYLVTGASLADVLLQWWIIWHVASMVFTFVGLNAAHHHPDIFHDGDKHRENRDWGLHQLDAVMDRVDINRSYYTVLTKFGEHGLHHLFPTLDHALLARLHEPFAVTCREFGTELRMTTQLELVLGQFKQLARTDTNPVARG